MTKERLELFRKWHAEEQAELEAQPRYEPTIDWKEDAVGELLAEVDRLRSLPVLRMCGDCRHYHLRSCEHPSVMTPGRATPTEHDAEPPTWCPRRGDR